MYDIYHVYVIVCIRVVQQYVNIHVVHDIWTYASLPCINLIFRVITSGVHFPSHTGKVYYKLSVLLYVLHNIV